MHAYMALRQKNTKAGNLMRKQRVEVIQISLRAMAKRLNIAPAHLTDIEKGRRRPSDRLLSKITKEYDLSEAELRTLWVRPDEEVDEILKSSSAMLLRAPELLRNAKNLDEKAWDKLIAQAKKMNGS